MAAELCPGINFPSPYPQGYGATPRLPRARGSYSRRAKEHASQGACTSTLRMAMAAAPYRLRPERPSAPPVAHGPGRRARRPETGGRPRRTAGGKGEDAAVTGGLRSSLVSRRPTDETDPPPPPLPFRASVTRSPRARIPGRPHLRPDPRPGSSTGPPPGAADDGRASCGGPRTRRTGPRKGPSSRRAHGPRHPSPGRPREVRTCRRAHPGRRRHGRSGSMGNFRLRRRAGRACGVRHVRRRRRRDRGRPGRRDRRLAGADAPVRAGDAARRGDTRTPGRRPSGALQPRGLTDSHARTHMFSANFACTGIPWRNGPSTPVRPGRKGPHAPLAPYGDGPCMRRALPCAASGCNAS